MYFYNGQYKSSGEERAIDLKFATMGNAETFQNAVFRVFLFRMADIKVVLSPARNRQLASNLLR